MDTLIERLIANYVSKLKKQDIVQFALKNDINLKEEEVTIVYDIIQKYWKEIIFENHETILQKIKGKINNCTYQKIEELIILYKEKYHSYL